MAALAPGALVEEDTLRRIHRRAELACMAAFFHGPRCENGFSWLRPLPRVRYLTNAYGLTSIRKRIVSYMVFPTADVRAFLRESFVWDGSDKLFFRLSSVGFSRMDLQEVNLSLQYYVANEFRRQESTSPLLRIKREIKRLMENPSAFLITHRMP